MGINGGARPGAGRKPGKPNQRTLEKTAVRRAIEQRILRKADRIHNAQFALAVGSYSIFRIDTDKNGTRSHTLVTDDDEAGNILDALQGRDQGQIEDSFAIVQYNKPDNRAIDSMLNRVFGKTGSTDEADQFYENKQQTARLFAVFHRALQDPEQPPLEQLAEAVEGYCKIKGIDPVEMAELVRQEIYGIDELLEHRAVLSTHFG